MPTGLYAEEAPSSRSIPTSNRAAFQECPPECPSRTSHFSIWSTVVMKVKKCKNVALKYAICQSGTGAGCSASIKRRADRAFARSSPIAELGARSKGRHTTA
jgi:hypothetical protein